MKINFNIISVFLIVIIVFIASCAGYSKPEPILLSSKYQNRIHGKIICSIGGLASTDTPYPVIISNQKLILCKNQQAREVLVSYDLPGEYYNHFLLFDFNDLEVDTYYLFVVCKPEKNTKNNVFGLKIFKNQNKISIINIKTNDFNIEKMIGITHTAGSDAYFLFQSSDKKDIYVFGNDGEYVKKFVLDDSVLISYYYVITHKDDPYTSLHVISKDHYSLYHISNLELIETKRINFKLKYKLEDAIIANNIYNDGYYYTFAVDDKIVVFYDEKDKPYSVIEGIKGITQKVSDSYYATSLGIIRIPSIEDNCKYLLVSDIPKNDYTVFDYSMYLAEVGPLVSYTLDNKNYVSIYYEGRYSDTNTYSYTFEFAERIESIVDTVDNIYFYSESNVYELNKKDLFDNYKDHKGVVFPKKVY